MRVGSKSYCFGSGSKHPQPGSVTLAAFFFIYPLFSENTWRRTRRIKSSRQTYRPPSIFRNTNPYNTFFPSCIISRNKYSTRVASPMPVFCLQSQRESDMHTFAQFIQEHEPLHCLPLPLHNLARVASPESVFQHKRQRRVR